MNRKNLRRLLSALAIVGLGGACGYSVIRRMDRNLTSIGHRITSTNGGYPIVIGSLSGGRLLACDYDKVGFHGYHTIDMRSGTKTLLSKLEAASNKEEREFAGDLSPDGQWLHHSRLYVGKPSHFFAIRLDGSRVMHWQPKKMDFSLSTWSADSQGGVLIDFNTGELTRWNLSDPVVHPIKSTHSSLSQQPEVTYMPIGPMAEGYLTYYESASNSLRFIRIGEDGKQQVLGTAKVPRDGKDCILHLSPGGKKLLWVVTYEMKPSKNPWLRKINGWLHMDSGHFDSIWTSDVDGTNLREVGYVRAEDVPDRLSAGWMQDGTRIWFKYKTSIWTVPAGG